MYDGGKCRWGYGNYQGVGGADVDLTVTARRELKSLWHGLETVHSGGKARTGAEALESSVACVSDHR